MSVGRAAETATATAEAEELKFSTTLKAISPNQTTLAINHANNIK